MQEDKNSNKKGFLKGMKAELKKVIWPTGEQTVKSTFVTIAFVLLIAAVLIVLNLLFGNLSSLWIKSITGEGTVINSIVSGDEVTETEEVENTDTEEVVEEESEETEEPTEEAVEVEVTSGEIVSGE